MTVKRTIRVVNQRGLHARASRQLAELALSYDTTRIFVKREDEEADARSLMDLMMLGAGIGQDVEVETRGPHAEEAMAAVEALFAAKFHEGE
jgi:phosphocarrier protein HPr